MSVRRDDEKFFWLVQSVHCKKQQSLYSNNLGTDINFCMISVQYLHKILKIVSMLTFLLTILGFTHAWYTDFLLLIDDFQSSWPLAD